MHSFDKPLQQNNMDIHRTDNAIIKSREASVHVVSNPLYRHSVMSTGRDQQLNVKSARVPWS